MSRGAHQRRVEGTGGSAKTVRRRRATVSGTILLPAFLLLLLLLLLGALLVARGRQQDDTETAGRGTTAGLARTGEGPKATKMNSVVVFYESASSNTDAGDEDSLKDGVNARFMCVFEAAARSLVGFDSDDYEKVRAASAVNRLVVYGDGDAEADAIRRSVRIVMERTMETYRDPGSTSGQISAYKDWFSLVTVVSTESEDTRRSLFDGTPLEWMVPDAAWKLVPSPVRSLSVRLAHVWHEGGVALKYDAIMTNSNSFSVTVFELVEELAASFESATTGLLSWRDAKQAIIGDSMFVFARGHPFVFACMENFKTAYAAHSHASPRTVASCPGTESKRN